MLKKLVPLFLVILLAGVFLPLVSLAAGGHTYKVCEGFPYVDKDSKESRCCGVSVQKDSNGDDLCNSKIDLKDVCYEGIVPCGKKVWVDGKWDDDNDRCDVNTGKQKNLPCQFCHFFIMIDGMIDYVLIMIVPSLTILVLVIGGIMFYFGGVKPELLSKSKTLFKGVVIGLVLIYGAYMIVGIVLTLLGATDVNPMSAVFNTSTGVFEINCDVSLPPTTCKAVGSACTRGDVCCSNNCDAATNKCINP